jgi:hypothetical protein
MATLGEAAKSEIIATARSLCREEISTFVSQVADLYGCSRGYIYRIIQKHVSSHRKPRSDKGKNKIEITEEHWNVLTGLTLRYDFAASHAIEWAESSGLLPAGVITPAMYNVRLRGLRLSRQRAKSDVRPVRRNEKDYPNEMHHFDTTKWEELYIDRDDIVHWAPTKHKKNSRGEKAPSLWLYSLVDDYSRAKYARIYKLENSLNHRDFFYHAWNRKNDPTKFPFFGLPQKLYMDLGSVNKADIFLQALKKLDVFVQPTTSSISEPHGSRKHGKVERVFQVYGEWFKELEIICPIPFDDLQARLEKFVLRINNVYHSETKTTPFARWMEISTPREAPSQMLYHWLFQNRATRTVNGDLSLSLDNHAYFLPAVRPYVDWIDEKVDVHWVPGDYSKITVVNGYAEIELNERAEVVRPSFNRAPIEQTSIDQQRAAVADIRYRDSQYSPIEVNAPAYMPKRGEKFDEKSVADKGEQTAEGWKPSFAPERWFTRIEAILELQRRDFFQRPPSPGDQLWLRDLMKERERISETEVNDAVILAQAEIENVEAGTNE